MLLHCLCACILFDKKSAVLFIIFVPSDLLLRIFSSSLILKNLILICLNLISLVNTFLVFHISEFVGLFGFLCLDFASDLENFGLLFLQIVVPTPPFFFTSETSVIYIIRPFKVVLHVTDAPSLIFFLCGSF